MHYTELSDEALHVMSEDLHAAREVTAQQEIASRLNNGAFYGNHPSHNFTGIDGRCMDCDCRPFGRHAPNPCI